MRELQRVTNVLGAGSYQTGFFPTLWGPLEQLRATTSILAMGGLDLNRSTASQFSFGRDGVLDVSPPPEKIVNAIGMTGSDEIAEANRQFWEALSHEILEEIVQALLAARLADVQTFWFQGFSTGHRKPAEETLRELKRRVPRQFIVAASVLPEDFDRRQRLRDGHDFFVRLKDEGVVETTFLVDNASLFARTFNLHVQDRYQAKAFASLLAAQLHFPKNPSLAEMGRSLGDYGAFVGMGFASRSVAVSKGSPGWAALRRLLPTLPDRGGADIGTVILETKEATKQAFSDRTCLAIEEEIHFDKPIFVVYTVPVRLEMTQQWLDFSGEIRRWLANSYPTVVPVFVSGNGTADPRFPGSYWVQASVLFPMPDVPAPLQAVIESKDAKRRKPAYPPDAPIGDGSGNTARPNGLVTSAPTTKRRLS